MQIFRSQDLQRKLAVIQEAAMEEPVVITYHDRPRLVLMSMREFDRLRGRRRKVGPITALPESVARGIAALADVEEDRPKVKRARSA
jgi:prevent-host-death family protein